MKEFIETMVKELVDDASAVKVEEKGHIEGTEDQELIEITVAKDDMGRIIGKEGRIIKAVRTLVRAVATKQGKYYRVDIIE